jgi:hypothetical protein
MQGTSGHVVSGHGSEFRRALPADPNGYAAADAFA